MATYTWNTGSGNFGAASNWTPAVVPGSGDTGIFGSSSGTISGTGAVASLTFASGGGWSIAGQLQSGAISDQGTLTVVNGGVLTTTSGQFGVGTASGATGVLTINAGGSVMSTIPAQTTSNELTVANVAGATGSVTVSGSGALLDMGANGAGIGNTGTGSLSVSAGGTVRLATSNSNLLAGLSAGTLAGSQSTISVSGTGSTMVVTGYMYIGRAGTATLTVSGGATFTGGIGPTGPQGSEALAIGDGSPTLGANGVANTSLYYGGSGSATVTGAGSLLHSLNQIRVGYRGTSGSLLVSNSGSAQADSNIIIGGGTDRTGGSGTLTVQSGSTVKAGGTHSTGTAGIVFGNDVGTSGQGTVTGAGSTLDTNGDRLTVGGSGSGTLTISGGGKALSGSAGYSDVEAAFAVAGGSGTTGAVTITGAGSQLSATGDAVLGGNEKSGAYTVGGTATVSVVSGGTLAVSGRLTIDAGATLTIDASSTLTTPATTINGGTANLAVLTGANAVTFGTGGMLAVTKVSGASTIGNFSFGDTIDVAGAASLSGNVVSTSTGSLTLSVPPANTSYQLFADGHGGELVTLTPQTIGVYRFFDTTLGTHFYTASASEAAAVAAARPDLTSEGIGLQAVAVQASDPNAVSVFRFFDTVHGTHFFTASATERDGLIAGRPDLTYEPASSFYEHATAQTGDIPVYRFFDSTYGTHFYTDSESERAGIVASRPDLVAEGIGFYEPKQNYAT